MRGYRGFILSLGLLFSPAALAQHYPSSTGEDLKTCDTHLQYKGKFINPHVVEVLEGWISDRTQPTINSVDVAAAWGTDQFFDADVTYAQDGAKYVTEDKPGNPSQSYSYKWIGRLSNGLHAIETTSWGGGGSMISTHLLLLRCSKGQGWRLHFETDSQGNDLPESRAQEYESYTRLNLTIDRSYSIGDRVVAAYALKGNTVTVTFPNLPKAHPLVIRADAK